MDKLVYVDPEYGTDITDDVGEKMAEIHPSQKVLLGVNDGAPAAIYHVFYRYYTGRGNARAQEKYMFLPKRGDGWDTVELVRIFMDWCERFNRRHPYRRISNIQVCSIEPFALSEREVVL